MPALDRPRRDPKKPFRARTPEPPPKTAGSWAVSKIFTKASAVVTADLQTFLLTCITGWDAYSLEEQRSIIDTLPISRRSYETDSETGELKCPLDADFVATDPYLKRAVKRFQTDVENGYYTQTWQRQSRQAMKDRAEGKFDEYLKHHVEETFGEGQDSSGEPSLGDGEVVFQGSSKDDSSDDEWNPSAKKKSSNNPRNLSMQVNDSQAPNLARSSRSRTTTPASFQVDDQART